MESTKARGIDFGDYARKALDLTEEIIERFGSRLAGSESSLKTAEYLRELFTAICGPENVEVQDFRTVTKAFLGFFRIIIPVYIVSLAFLYLRMVFPALLGFWFIITSSFLEFGLYREFFDVLYRRKHCRNVIARLEPKGQVLRQVILSGHHDSAYELTFLRNHQKLLIPRIAIPELFYGTAAVFSLVLFAYRMRNGEMPPAFTYFLGALTAGLLFIIPKFFMVGKKGTPGAGDNLIASSMLLQFAQMFADPEHPGTSTLESTRILLISFDAEESGLRGARHYARKHRKEFRKIPTYMLNYDSIYERENLKFLFSDLNGLVRLSRPLAEHCRKLAAAREYSTKLYSMPYGAGATDAAELAVRGVQATTLIGISTKATRDNLAYHTMNDTVDRIEPEAIEACLSVGADLVWSMEREKQDGSS